MVIDQVVLNDPPSVPLVEDDDMVEALSPHRADKPLRVRILPRRARRRPDLGDAHTAQAAGHGVAEDPVVVMDQQTRGRVEGEGVLQLPDDPRCRGRSGHIEVDNTPPRVMEKHKDIQHAPGERRHGEEIHRRRGVHVVADKRLPRR